MSLLAVCGWFEEHWVEVWVALLESVASVEVRWLVVCTPPLLLVAARTWLDLR